ncbi:MAG: polysaccharide pyruvyl transferase family protein, partial [Cyanobacteria bacterium]|nr:polysaccharide pyruvyl transferase family protein [Cyanobacteriota bacterium]
MKIGLFSYNTANIGDDLQSIAALHLLKKIKEENPSILQDDFEEESLYWLDRDKNQDYNAIAPKEGVFLIANGWYSQGHFPFPDWVKPLFISVHTTPFWLEHNPHVFDYFRQHQPIGCRDEYTLYQMKKHQIQAYLSYCLSLNMSRDYLSKDYNIPSPPKTYLINIPEELIPYLMKHYAYDKSTFQWQGHHVDENMKSPLDGKKPVIRHAMAHQILNDYAHAKCVLTCRIHATLPCIALGTPVQFLPLVNPEERAFGYEDLFNLPPSHNPYAPSQYKPFPSLSEIQRFHRLIVSQSIR